MNGKFSPETAPRTASLPRTQEYTLLAQFSLSLIKAMLQAGYYAPDHPEAQKALPTLYSEFRQVIGDRPELTYLAGTTGSTRTIMIDGYELAPLSLAEVMLKGMAELFTPKFLEFFDRRNLLSFSLKAAITAEEFQGFIELMSQPPVASHEPGDERERLTQGFLDQHILHISTVFNDDIVGKERRLPWRVQMALSRLRRDLRILPLYQRATPEEIRRVKIQIIDDVIRPVRAPELLKDFLVNCDLVAADIAVLEATQVEREIVGRLSKEMLVPAVREFVKDLERLGRAPGEGQSKEMTRRLDILREVVDSLGSEAGGLEHDLLEWLLQRQVVSLEDLPLDLQHALQTRRLANTFLARKDEHVQALARFVPDEAGSRLATMVLQVLPELLRQREYQAVAAVLNAVNEGRRVPGTETSQALEQLAGPLHQALATEDALTRALEDLGCRAKDERNHLVEILAFVGDAAGPGLLKAYATTDDRSVRASVFEAIRRIGRGALRPFLERLPDIEREWLVVRHILAAVGEHGDPSLAPPISRFLQHAHVHVRQAALTALFKLLGHDAESHCLRALPDREAAVRQVAVEYLGRLKSRHPQALAFYAAALSPDAPSAPPENDAVLVQVCQALAGFEAFPADTLREAERILLAALRPRESKGFLHRFTHASHSEQVRIAVCEALAAVGAPTAVGILRDVGRGHGPVAEKAKAAARQIQERASQTSPA